MPCWVDRFSAPSSHIAQWSRSEKVTNLLWITFSSAISLKNGLSQISLKFCLPLFRTYMAWRGKGVHKTIHDVVIYVTRALKELNTGKHSDISNDFGIPLVQTIAVQTWTHAEQFTASDRRHASVKVIEINCLDFSEIQTRCPLKPRSNYADLEVPISTIWKIVENGMVGSWSRGNIVLTSWKSARSENDRQRSGSQHDKALL